MTTSKYRSIRPVAIASLAAMSLILAATSAGAATMLDPTFHGDGLRFTSFSGSASANALALQSDGGIVVAGTSEAADADFALARYFPSGDLDTTFGGDGRVTVEFGGDVHAWDVAVDADGAIVVVGGGGAGFAVARLTPQGDLDDGFSGDGRKVVPLGAASFARAVELTSAGAILVGGDVEGGTAGSRFGLLRLRSDGGLDGSFGGGDGIVLTAFPQRAHLWGLALGGDGSIVASGGVEDPDFNSRFAVAKYRPGGALDPSFGGDGRVATRLLSDAVAFDVEVTAGGKVVAGGGAFFIDLERFEFALARYLGNGRLDTTFGGDGKVTTAFGGFDSEATIDDIELVGSTIAAVGPSFFADDAFQMARYVSHGALDPAFGTAGRFLVPLPNTAEGSGLAVDTGGRYVVAGTLFGTEGSRFAVARVIP